MKKQLAILGSTGSIGTQALEVVAEHPDLFEIYTLTAHNNADLLIEQARQFEPEAVVIANEAHYQKVADALADRPVKVYAGQEAIAQIVESEPIDMVLTAMVGYAGLYPTIRAIQAGKAIALANKETLVVAGELINSLALEHKTAVIPVDSEHSAIFQCLAGETHNPIEKIILTASGGPFRTFTREQMRNVKPQDALKHPRWKMGNKITIDSATMMNKGFEVIEAKWLFNVKPEQIEVVVHPQSIIHSMIEFEDGAVKAQLGTTDMRLPICYALSYPNRLKCSRPKLTVEAYSQLTFERPNMENFPLLGYAYEAMKTGGNRPCILNAANEIAVAAFLAEQIGFLDIATLIGKTMEKIPFIKTPTYEDYVQTDKESRIQAQELIKHLS